MGIPIRIRDPDLELGIWNPNSRKNPWCFTLPHLRATIRRKPDSLYDAGFRRHIFTRSVIFSDNWIVTVPFVRTFTIS